MKAILLLAASLLGKQILGAEALDVIASAKKLADKPNYSWTTTVFVPPGTGGRFRPGPSFGKTEKEGYTWFSMIKGQHNALAVMKGGKGVVLWDGEWKTFDEMLQERQPRPERFLARKLKFFFKLPPAEAEDLVSKVKSLKKEADVYNGELSEHGAKALLTFRRSCDGDPMVSGGKGTARFWVTDGRLAKYEYHVEGLVHFNGEDRKIDRTVTTEIMEAGTTKVEVPQEAKNKLSLTRLVTTSEELGR